MTPDENVTGAVGNDARLADSLRALQQVGEGPAPAPSDRLAAFLAAPTAGATGVAAAGWTWFVKEKMARLSSAGKVIVIGGSIALAGAVSATAAWQVTAPPPAEVVVPPVPVLQRHEPRPSTTKRTKPASDDASDAADPQDGTKQGGNGKGDTSTAEDADQRGAGGKSDDSDDDADKDNSGKSDDSDDDADQDNSGKSDDSDDDADQDNSGKSHDGRRRFRRRGRRGFRRRF